MDYQYYLIRGLVLFFGLSSYLPAHAQQKKSATSEDRTHYFPPTMFPGKYPDQIILNLCEDPLTCVSVNWRTDSTIRVSTLQFSESTPGPQFRRNVRKLPAQSSCFSNKYRSEPEITSYYHSAKMTDLSPGQQYVYRVGVDTFWSEWFQFDMPNPKKEPITFIYFGDAQNELKSMWSRVIREAFRKVPQVDFMLHAGDLINRYNRDLEWAEWFNAGGFIHAMVPSMMTPGNHEYRNSTLAPQWREQFSLPLNGPTGLEETCYQINYPDLKVISIDAEQLDDNPHFRKQQVAWLDSILTNDPKIWTVVTLHYPLFSTKPERDNPRIRQALKPVFDKHQVDLVLQGHDHAYGRGLIKNKVEGISKVDKKSGTVYVVSVSGPKMYSLSPKQWMDRKAINTQLFQMISVSPEILTYQSFTAMGTLYDAFDLVRIDGKPAKFVNRIPNVQEIVD